MIPKINIEEFITKNNLKPVTSLRIYDSKNKLEPNGLFSEEIFGVLGSKQRKKTFSYIDLHCKIVHPEVYDILCSLDPSISKILSNKKKFVLDEKGRFIENEGNGQSGVEFFVSVIDKINFELYTSTKPKELNFIKNNFEYLTISKQIVLPAGVRDITIDTRTQKSFIRSDINNLYESMIKQVSSITGDTEIDSMIVQSIQRTSKDINNWIKSIIKGKTGIIKGGLLNKRIDYTARLVIAPDPNLRLGDVGLPWQVVLKLFEPFAIYHLLNHDQMALGLIQNLLSLEDEPDINNIKRFLGKINENTDICSPMLKDYLRSLAKEIAVDKVILYKRDPVENRDSYLCSTIRVDDEGYVMKLNPVETARNGADFDGDAMAIYAIFSKEATQEAKSKMHPRYSSGVWLSDTVSSNNSPYRIIHDACASIYNATKN